ncbi:MAG: LVIVD repeat-containing protein [Candidatus Hodarchaeales archaeon]|jgi:hypothetical protein
MIIPIITQTNKQMELSKIGQAPTGGDAYDLWVDENKALAYITCGYYGFLIFDVSDVSNPIRLSHVAEDPAIINTGHLTGYAHQFFINDDIVFIGDGATGLTIINCSDPTNPYIVTHYTGGYAWDIQIVEDIAYMAKGFMRRNPGIEVLNVSNLSNPVLIKSIDTQGDINDLCIQGNHLFLVSWEEGLLIYDITNKSDPMLVDQYKAQNNDEFEYIEVVNDVAYLVNWEQGLKIFNVADLSNISIIGNYNDTGECFSLSVYDKLGLLATTEGLKILNMTDSTNLFEIGIYYENGRVNRALLINSHIYVADQDNGLIILKMEESKSSKRIIGNNCDLQKIW